ncbi:uncharacterized protein RHO25_000387 [Cercospora beticola]|uniref:Uncharacterized protein n=1 Tax=Cercospora beticola TaxID=122368 RepID=A0ABZ0N8C5_CERBT|nr:hypothetical protein RHO25_000387 [Cercospora beticola]CAK1355965.1 unnamed protein product [Cercospora beticola]
MRWPVTNTNKPTQPAHQPNKMFATTEMFAEKKGKSGPYYTDCVLQGKKGPYYTDCVLQGKKGPYYTDCTLM